MSRVEDRIREGALARSGAISEEDVARAAEVVALVEADGIETVRVVLADPHGILRGKTITAEALTDAFASGIRAPSTLLLKDVSHRTAFPVWSDTGDAPMLGASDLLMAPLPGTFRVLPWSPHSALIHCDVAMTSGEPVAFASRCILQSACDRLSERDMRAVMGLEVEFQVFEVVDPALEHADTTMPARPPVTRALNQGYQYLTETRYGEAEAILDTLRRAAQAMGMPVRSVEIEMGPSQFEFTFAAADPMTIADMAVNFRTMVKEVCHREGLLASFMARPRLPNAASNGWHIHQSLADAERAEPLHARCGRCADASGERLDCRAVAARRGVLHRHDAHGERLQALHGLPAGARPHRLGRGQSRRHAAHSHGPRRSGQPGGKPRARQHRQSLFRARLPDPLGAGRAGERAGRAAAAFPALR